MDLGQRHNPPVPERGTVMFMPHRPYIPLGTLREALTYPAPPDRFSDKSVRTTLTRIRLHRLTPLLTEKRWDKELTLDEQQRVALARALLHKPAWIIQDEAMSELDDDSRRLAGGFFKHHLPGTWVVGIGKKSDDGNFSVCILNLRASLPGLHLPLTLRPRLTRSGMSKIQ